VLLLTVDGAEPHRVRRLGGACGKVGSWVLQRWALSRDGSEPWDSSGHTQFLFPKEVCTALSRPVRASTRGPASSGLAGNLRSKSDVRRSRLFPSSRQLLFSL
jgi:hypothetical protein